MKSMTTNPKPRRCYDTGFIDGALMALTLVEVEADDIIETLCWEMDQDPEIVADIVEAQGDVMPQRDALLAALRERIEAGEDEDEAA